MFYRKYLHIQIGTIYQIIEQLNVQYPQKLQNTSNLKPKLKLVGYKFEN